MAEWEDDPELHRLNEALGQEFRDAREARAWSRTIVGKRSGLKRGVIGKIEAGEPVRNCHYQSYAHVLGLRLGLMPDTTAPNDLTITAVATRVLSVILEVERESDTVNRRHLVLSLATLFVDAAVPVSVRRLFAESGCPSLSAADVQALSADCGEYLRHRDATSGGGAAYEVAIAMHEQAATWLENGSHPPRVTRALEFLCCDLKAWIAWLAVDAGHLKLAERYLEKTIMYARLADCPDAEARAIDSMCVLQEQRMQPEQLLRTARVGIRLAEGDGDPKLQALFHLRAATAHALLGDSAGFAGQVGTSRALLGEMSHGQSRPWLQFLTTGADHIGFGHLVLRQSEQAIAELRTIVDDRSSNYHRDVVQAQVQIAQAHAFLGDYSQAGELGTEALPDVMALSSEWIRGECRQLYTYLRAQPAIPHSARAFVAAYDEMTMAMT